MMKKVAIVGAGPAGLFSAYQLLKSGVQVDLYDHSSGVGKKFLVAGNGGLNLTHSEELEQFSKRYFKDEKRFSKWINDFGPNDLREWCLGLNVETFVGSSGRVFPTEFKAADILKKWQDHLKSSSFFNLYLKHKLIDFDHDLKLCFEGPDGEIEKYYDNVIFAMGGASWKKTGSNGQWANLFKKLDIKVNEFLPMNCGFERPWSKYFINNVERLFLKHVEVSFLDKKVKGDLMITAYGIEGGVIYALSNIIRDMITTEGECSLSIDLRPGLTEEALYKKIKDKSKKVTMSNHLRKSLNLDKQTFTFLKEVLTKNDFDDLKVLAKKIKSLKVSVFKARPIDEAISTSGGVCFSELTDSLELKKVKGAFVVGEMLDFEAPTGGYLIQGAFSTAWAATQGILDHLT